MLSVEATTVIHVQHGVITSLHNSYRFFVCDIVLSVEAKTVIRVQHSVETSFHVKNYVALPL